MRYKNSTEIAKLWNLNPRTVRNYCMNNKIAGAVYTGKQWLIPEDAQMPMDGRTKEAKELPAKELDYHFPVLIFSPLYNRKEELTEDELKLLEAQKLHFQGQYSQSMELARSLISSHTPVYLLIGIYDTLGFNSLPLGLSSTFSRAVEKIEQLIQKPTSHLEDYKLILYMLQFHVDFNSKPILQLDPTKLSSEATTYYYCSLLQTSCINGTCNNLTSYRFFQSCCFFAQKDNITALQMAMNGFLGALDIDNIENSEKEKHISKSIELAVENNWLAEFVKIYRLNSSYVEAAIIKFDPKLIDRIKEWQKFNLQGLRLVHRFVSQSDHWEKFTLKQAELLLLVSHDYSYNQIAQIKGTELKTVKKDIKELCNIAEVQTLAQLSKYAKQIFSI